MNRKKRLEIEGRELYERRKIERDQEEFAEELAEVLGGSSNIEEEDMEKEEFTFIFEGKTFILLEFSERRGAVEIEDEEGNIFNGDDPLLKKINKDEGLREKMCIFFEELDEFYEE